MKWMAFTLAATLAVAAADKLAITAPDNVTLTEGAAKAVTLKISLEKEAAEEITVTLEDLPEGVKVAEASRKIAKGGKDAEFALTTETGDKFKEVTNHVAKAVAKSKDEQVKATFKITTKKKG